MPVIIHVAGKVLPGNTHTVSAGGAMVILKEGIGEGTKVTVENPATNVKVEGKVIRPPQMNQEGSLVPVEFCHTFANVLEHLFPAPFYLDVFGSALFPWIKEKRPRFWGRFSLFV